LEKGLTKIWLKVKLIDMKNKASIIKALVSMAYRPLDGQETKWAKPIGFGLVSFNFDDYKFSSYFYAANTGKSEIWVADYLLEKYFENMSAEEVYARVISFIAEFEAYQVKTDVYYNGVKAAFLTDKEEASFFLGGYK